MPVNNQKQNLEKFMYNWVTGEAGKVNIPADYYCKTRDIFQARLDLMIPDLLKKKVPEEDAYTVLIVAGEIGNNSFDHNLGNWPDIMGVFFAYNIVNDTVEVLLADRGQGLLKTLKKIKPKLENNNEALQTAFTERISGRSPENRGNGLKLVKETVKNKKMNLIFISGDAQAELNDKMVIKSIDKNVRGCLAILKYQIA